MRTYVEQLGKRFVIHEVNHDPLHQRWRRPVRSVFQ
jgi:hypothetical protein